MSKASSAQKRVAHANENKRPEPETSQRIFQRKNKRYAIRLEHEFWAQLEQCAKEERRKLSDVLFDVIIGTSGEVSNRTALLRIYCVKWLQKKLAEAEQPDRSMDIQTALSACPSPCVIMTKEKAIIAYNTAFAEKIVSRLSETRETKDKNSPLTFRLDTPLEQIHSDLLEGKARYRDAQAAFVKKDKMIRVGARFCLLETQKNPNSSLLCYLTAG